MFGGKERGGEGGREDKKEERGEYLQKKEYK